MRSAILGGFLIPLLSAAMYYANVEGKEDGLVLPPSSVSLPSDGVCMCSCDCDACKGCERKPCADEAPEVSEEAPDIPEVESPKDGKPVKVTRKAPYEVGQEIVKDGLRLRILDIWHKGGREFGYRAVVLGPSVVRSRGYSLSTNGPRWYQNGHSATPQHLASAHGVPLDVAMSMSVAERDAAHSRAHNGAPAVVPRQSYRAVRSSPCPGGFCPM